MNRKGFTLIETLCVIAIIAVIVAILFPIFGRAKQAAKETSCIQNLKNLYVATALYREENSPTVEFGDPYQMGLPSPIAMLDILAKTSGKDEYHQSPCGRHPRLDDDFGGYTTIYFMPQDPSSFKAYVIKHEGSSPLWVDPNCSPASTPIRLQFGIKRVFGVMLDGHVMRKERSDVPFWSMRYFE